MSKLIAFLIVGLAATTAGAAVIYLPVQYQYGSGAAMYYYGGNDPAVFARAERTTQILAITAGRDVPNLPIRTYTNLMPYQPNAMVYGFNANDARNEAYESVPCYFRMADILPAASTAPTQNVRFATARPAAAGTIEIKPYVRPAVQPTTRPVLILPAAPKPSAQVR